MTETDRARLCPHCKAFTDERTSTNNGFCRRCGSIFARDGSVTLTQAEITQLVREAATLAEPLSEQEIREGLLRNADELIAALTRQRDEARSALAAAVQARADSDPHEDRDFIEQKFREGMREADVPDPATCPYEAHSLAGHWWTRGFAYQSRNLRAIAAEQARADAERQLQHLRSQIQFVFLGGGPLAGTAQEQFSQLCEVVDKERFDAERERDEYRTLALDSLKGNGFLPAAPFGPWFRAALAKM